MSLKQYLVILFISSVVRFSCDSSRKSTSDAPNESTKSKTHSTKMTQALLLTQPFEFDLEQPKKITGDYISLKKLDVPSSLPSQHKWIMFEGPVLENDLVAFRFYGDSRHRVDIFGKRVSDLVLDTVSWNYHDIMDWGSDILKVGNSLGLGSPAIWYHDSLYTLSECEEKTIEIIQNEDRKSVIRTSFKNVKVKDQKIDLEQDWSIEAGQPWSEINLKIVNRSLPDGMKFATGIAKHLPEIIEGETSNYFYGMNWGKQSFHEENLGMAIIVEKKYQPKTIKNDLNHAYALNAVEGAISYRLLAAWERDVNEVKDANGFEQIVLQAAK